MLQHIDQTIRFRLCRLFLATFDDFLPLNSVPHYIIFPHSPISLVFLVDLDRESKQRLVRTVENCVRARVQVKTAHLRSLKDDVPHCLLRVQTFQMHVRKSDLISLFAWPQGWDKRPGSVGRRPMFTFKRDFLHTIHHSCVWPFLVKVGKSISDMSSQIKQSRAKSSFQRVSNLNRFKQRFADDLVPESEWMRPQILPTSSKS